MLRTILFFLIQFILLLAGAVLVIMAVTGAVLGLGYLATLFAPLDLFQGTVVVAASTTVAVLIIQFIYFVSVSPDPRRAADGGKKRTAASPARSGRFKDLNEALQNSACPCGSGKKVKDCCGA